MKGGYNTWACVYRLNYLINGSCLSLSFQWILVRSSTALIRSSTVASGLAPVPSGIGSPPWTTSPIVRRGRSRNISIKSPSTNPLKNEEEDDFKTNKRVTRNERRNDIAHTHTHTCICNINNDRPKSLFRAGTKCKS